MELLITEANNKMRQGDFESALHICEQILIEYPDSPHGHITIGLCYKELERFAEAENHLQQAIKMDEKSALPYHALCYLAYKKKDMQAFLTFAEKAYALESNSYESLFLLGLAKIENKERSKGIEYLNQAAQIKPDDINLHWNLYLAYVEENNWKLASDESKILYKLDPSLRIVLIRLFDVFGIRKINNKQLLLCSFILVLVLGLIYLVVLLGSIAFLNPYFSIALYLALIYLIRYGFKIRNKRSTIGNTIITLSFIVLVLHFTVMVSYNFGPMR